MDSGTSFALSLNSCAIADDGTRDHPASEVYVTGTFDDWAKSVKLEKKGDGFEKLVELPPSEDRILYKVGIFPRCFWQEQFSSVIRECGSASKRIIGGLSSNSVDSL